VLEVAENNDRALGFYRKRNFYKLDAAIFLSKKVAVEAELLPPRKLKSRPRSKTEAAKKVEAAKKTTNGHGK
jgi:ribosomal protein S18 acetylase RimI-like enzyme